MSAMLVAEQAKPRVRIIAWNAEWASPRSQRFQIVKATLTDLEPDVICVTEGFAELLPKQGYIITSEPDYGYPIKEGRRKILLWSREEWVNVDTVGRADLPPGRFAAGETMTPVGSIHFFGVCIPWRDAHVRTGHKNRGLWEDHLIYLSGLGRILKAESEHSSVILGDFNQTVPRRRQRLDVYTALEVTLKDRYRIVTAGNVDGLEKPLIDHIATSAGLNAVRINGISRFSSDGTRLSDHNGVIVDLVESH